MGKISEMDHAGTLTGDELIPMVQGGENVTVTVAELAAKIAELNAAGDDGTGDEGEGEA